MAFCGWSVPGCQNFWLCVMLLDSASRDVLGWVNASCVPYELKILRVISRLPTYSRGSLCMLQSTLARVPLIAAEIKSSCDSYHICLPKTSASNVRSTQSWMAMLMAMEVRVFPPPVFVNVLDCSVSITITPYAGRIPSSSSTCPLSKSRVGTAISCNSSLRDSNSETRTIPRPAVETTSHHVPEVGAPPNTAQHAR